MSLPNKAFQSQWELRTEYIIAMLGIGFALFLFGLNIFFGLKSPLQMASQGIQSSPGQQLSVFAYWFYPLICIGRLAWFHFRPTGKVYIWLSALTDTFFLTVIIYAFSLQYQTASASLLAPTFGFYYVIIALHAMRFNARLVIVMGFSTILIWTVMLSSFLFQGAAVTQSYAQYISSTDVLIGSEIERLVALGLFSTLLAIGVKRAQDLLSEAAEKRISDIKMIESEKSSRVKTEFLATMSHELRTPLNGVLGMSEVLRRTELSETQESFVDVIEKSGQDLLSIIEDILDYTQLESEEMTRHIDEFELSNILTKVDKKLRQKAEKKALDFQIVAEGAENITFIGDEFRLKRILINLLGNAIKFTEEGFVSLYITTTKTDAQSAVLSVYVQDSGIGIAEENFELIFEKFTQADNSKTRQYGGAGLGLSISQSLVRAEGGEIKLLSRLGQGSKFYFDIALPYKSQVPANLETTRSQYTKQNKVEMQHLNAETPRTLPLPHPPPQDVKNSGTVLIIGHGETGPVLNEQVATLGLATTYEANVKAALIDMAKAYNSGQPYDALIIDCDIPNLDWTRLIKLIRSKARLDELDIIALYSQDNLSLREKLETMNVKRLVRPYNLTALKTVLPQTRPAYKSVA